MARKGFWLAWASGFGVLIAGGGPGVRGSDADTSFEVFRAALEQWRSGLEFRCHFVLRGGDAPTKEAALTGEFDAAAGTLGSGEKIVGVFHKKGEKIRLCIDYGKPPRDATGRGTFESVTGVSYDAVAMNGLQAEYWPRSAIPAGKAFGGHAAVERQPEGWSDSLGLVTTCALLTPLWLNFGTQGVLYESWGKASCQVGTVTRSVEKPDREHTTLVVMVRKPDGATQSRRVTFWTAVSPPVIKRIDDASDVPGRPVGRNLEWTTVASRFVRCGKGMMASEVRSVTGPLTLANQPTAYWIACRWSSEDLGKGPPTDDDFVLTLPPGVDVIGLKTPPPDAGERRLDLAKYTANDLDTGGAPTPPADRAHPERPSPATDRRIAPTVALAGVCLLLLLVFAILLRWWRASGK
jgi:hypothetical protein